MAEKKQNDTSASKGTIPAGQARSRRKTESPETQDAEDLIDVTAPTTSQAEIAQRRAEEMRRQAEYDNAGGTSTQADDGWDEITPAETDTPASREDAQEAEAMLERARVRNQKLRAEEAREAAAVAQANGADQVEPRPKPNYDGRYLVDNALVDALASVRDIPMQQVDSKLEELFALLDMRRNAVSAQQHQRLTLLAVLQIKQDW